MRLTKKQAAARAKFRAAMIEYFASKGAEARGDRPNEFTLATPIGPLRVSVFDDWVATCFDSHRAGYKFSINANRASGKWNFHYFEAELDTAVADIDRNISRLLAYEPDAETLRLMREDLAEQDERRRAMDAWLANYEATKQTA